MLADFDPRVIGTLPLGLDISTSDIDVAVHASDPDAVADILWARRERLTALSLRRWTHGDRPLVAEFTHLGWSFEVFAAPVPVIDQAGWRHFDVERRLLSIGGERLRNAVRTQRLAGLKTEPAFAAVLALAGDPYSALLKLYLADDAELTEIVDHLDK